MSVTYSLLDKNGVELVRYKEKACFSEHTYTENINSRAWIPGTQYLKYDLVVNNITNEDASRYLKFMAKIPWFKPLLPLKLIKQIVETRSITIDLSSMNGLQAFVLLTIIRGLEEEQSIVKAIAKFGIRKIYKYSHWQRLKIISAHKVFNTNHWLFPYLNATELEFDKINTDFWNNPKSAKDTGLHRKIFVTFVTSENANNYWSKEKKLFDTISLEDAYAQ